jgi:hypothetical protein
LLRGKRVQLMVDQRKQAIEGVTIARLKVR